jgi:hypothetical protein
MVALDTISVKEQSIFYRGVGAGIVGGLLSNLLASAMIEIFTSSFPMMSQEHFLGLTDDIWLKVGLFVITLVAWLYVLWLLVRKIETLEQQS